MPSMSFDPWNFDAKAKPGSLGRYFVRSVFVIKTAPKPRFCLFKLQERGKKISARKYPSFPRPQAAVHAKSQVELWSFFSGHDHKCRPHGSHRETTKKNFHGERGMGFTSTDLNEAGMFGDAGRPHACHTRRGVRKERKESRHREEGSGTGRCGDLQVDTYTHRETSKRLNGQGRAGQSRERVCHSRVRSERSHEREMLRRRTHS